MENFIIEFKQALDADFCAHLIAKFEQSPHKKDGKTGGGVDKQKKDSVDLTLSGYDEWQPERNHIEQTIIRATGEYAKLFPFILTGAVAPAVLNPETQESRSISHEDIAHLDQPNLERLVSAVYRNDDINIQRYTKGQGGYHHWHSEQFPYPNDVEQKSLHRVLLWLLYLNDVDQGGETDFYYQQVQVKPSRGSLVLAPCGFTHTHRGCVPTSGDKYVLASWVLYHPAETLYASRP